MFCTSQRSENLFYARTCDVKEVVLSDRQGASESSLDACSSLMSVGSRCCCSCVCVCVFVCVHTHTQHNTHRDTQTHIPTHARTHGPTNPSNHARTHARTHTRTQTYIDTYHTYLLRLGGRRRQDSGNCILGLQQLLHSTHSGNVRKGRVTSCSHSPTPHAYQHGTRIRTRTSTRTRTRTRTRDTPAPQLRIMEGKHGGEKKNLLCEEVGSGMLGLTLKEGRRLATNSQKSLP